MKTISIREAYDWLQIGKQINQTEWDELLRFLQEKYFKSVEIGNGKIRFINLVGIIQLSTLRIEILPKLVIHEESEGKNREALINMLTVTRTLPITLYGATSSQLAKSDLFHVFAQVYIQSLLTELRRGIHKEYKLIEENSPSLKGRFLFHQHIRKNAFQPVKAYCEYDEIQEDVALNRILKRALKMVFPYISKSSLKSESLYILEMFDQVADVQIQQNDLRNFRFNRQNQRFQDAFLIAKLILENRLMTSKYSGEQSFAFLFEMNVLFESYIERALRSLEWEENFKVIPQHDEKRLLININSGKENIKLKPDFVVFNPEEQMIVDTKWKNIIRDGRVTYQQADLYQMYAYITSYEEAKRCILLYPKSEEGVLPKWQVPGREKFIEVHTIRLTSLVETLADLRSIII